MYFKFAFAFAAVCELLCYPTNLFPLTISDWCFQRQMTKSIFRVLLFNKTFHQSSRKADYLNFQLDKVAQVFSADASSTHTIQIQNINSYSCVYVSQYLDRNIPEVSQLFMLLFLSMAKEQWQQVLFVVLSYCSILLHICYWFSIVTPKLDSSPTRRFCRISECLRFPIWSAYYVQDFQSFYVQDFPLY